ncbi:ABC transporter permease [Dactylosporangium roseum]|uniref:ABC transporter permease n=1 Tax=Dactylosporangium roseum TaxID=47989 RepID=A0ABY5YXM5_9ACTN|nr:ABC transporter permease [Dactylosporangium roseum]UWZ34505.1 ABC transporter permease [Dactylosporangium roseum]
MTETPVVPPRGLFRRRPSGRSRPLALFLGIGLGVVVIGGALLLMTFGHLDPGRTAPVDRLKGLGTTGHVLGTDQLGRDMLARGVAGLRWSVAVGVVSTCLVSGIGTVVGLWAASARGLVRVLLTRLIDMSLSFPSLVLAVTIMAIVGRGFWALSLTLGLVSWPIFARVVYAEAIGLMKREYILAARLLGVSGLRTVVTHVLPGIRNTLLVMWAFMFADLLIAESGLSFLGLGVPLGTPSLGGMLAESREYLAQAPHMVLVPGLTIVVIVVTANLIGDALSSRSHNVTAVVNR